MVQRRNTETDNPRNETFPGKMSVDVSSSSVDSEVGKLVPQYVLYLQT